MATSMICNDFLEFQESLKKLRAIDDKIVYALNTSIPTDSFRSQRNTSNECKILYEEIQEVHTQRDMAIRTCIANSSDIVRSIKEKREHAPDDRDLLKSLRKEQTKLRLMQTEINVEEVVKNRTLKIFYEKCRSSYKPKDLKL